MTRKKNIINIMLKGWKKITIDDIEKIQKYNSTLDIVEYFNSIIYQIYSNMIYKEINNKLVIAKASAIMGNYSIIKFYGDNTLNESLLKNKFTLRGHDIKGKKDRFGDEYIYDTDECIKLEGSKFYTFRKSLSKYKGKIKIDNGFHDDIYEILKLYPNHQTKLFTVINKYPFLITVTRVYIDNQILGFSIVENINAHNGIIIQELFNKDMGVRNASYLVHYFNCLNNKSKKLNAGGSRNKNIKFAKNKLRPTNLIKIKRLVSSNKLTRDEWFYFRNNML